jgi:hypothetical protein
MPSLCESASASKGKGEAAANRKSIAAFFRKTAENTSTGSSEANPEPCSPSKKLKEEGTEVIEVVKVKPARNKRKHVTFSTPLCVGDAPGSQNKGSEATEDVQKPKTERLGRRRGQKLRSKPTSGHLPLKRPRAPTEGEQKHARV